MRKTTRAKESPFLLERYYHLGWLNRRYLVNCKYIQPYSAEDRLLIGKQLYEDFIYWQRGIKLTHAYENGYVDVDISHKCERPPSRREIPPHVKQTIQIGFADYLSDCLRRTGNTRTKNDECQRKTLFQR